MPKFRKTEAVESLLRAWYGRSRGRMEAIPWLPKPCSLGNALKGIEKQLRSSRVDELLPVIELWGEMVGVRLAKYSRPAGFDNKFLVVEYDRAALLPELLRSRTQLLSRLHIAFGDSICSGLRFIPVGGKGQ